MPGEHRSVNVEMEDAASFKSRPSFGGPPNIFAQTQQQIKTIVPQKKLVSVETLMRHTGNKQELHTLLTVQGKCPKAPQSNIMQARYSCQSYATAHLSSSKTS